MSTSTETKKLPTPEALSPRRQKVAILDTGAQYGKNVDRRVRGLGVDTDFLPVGTSWEELQQYGAIIIPGGPDSVYKEGSPRCDPRVFSDENHPPVLGICYGMQLMNHTLGGAVERTASEYGQRIAILEQDSMLFGDLEQEQKVLMSHGDTVTEVPDGFRVTARSNGAIAAMENREKRLYAVQFHPEVKTTERGKDILGRFLFEISGFKGDFTIEDREAKAIKEIREKVGQSPVSLLVSGGVDSTVLSALLRKALPADQIHAFHFDNGFMRKDESEKVRKALEAIGVTLEVIDASQDFLTAVGNSVDPEFKRKTIGDVFLTKARQLMIDRGFNPDEVFFAQGTLRPDLIESGSKVASGKADGIKTHHNDSPLAREFRDAGRLLEPLQELHKDEVRELGANLGLPKEMVLRQPFPGPGLAIRIIGADTDSLTLPDSAHEAMKHIGDPDINATLLPVMSVGVQGDERSYKHVVGLSGKEDWNKLLKLAEEIPEKVKEVNRVVYVFGKRILEYGIKDRTVTIPSREVEQAQLADDIVNEVLLKYDLLEKLSQVPVILTGVNFGKKGKRSVVIRTFITDDFYTGVPAIPGSEYMPEDALNEMVDRIVEEVPGISRVMYDLTSKPPGTTEWE